VALSTVAVAIPVAAQSDAVPAAEGRLEEIVVTAQKEQQNLQEVAAALTAIDSDSLLASGITDLRAVQMLAPAARFQAEGNNTQVFIRGVGASLDLPNVEPSVAFIFGGSYVPREGTTAAFFDLAQVEVLPGPQGTLYGRSAIGVERAPCLNRRLQDSSAR
jgi:iron complex outermembrane receptor protein